MYKCVDTIVCMVSRQLCKPHHYSTLGILVVIQFTQLTRHDPKTVVPTQDTL